MHRRLFFYDYYVIFLDGALTLIQAEWKSVLTAAAAVLIARPHRSEQVYARHFVISSLAVTVCNTEMLIMQWFPLGTIESILNFSTRVKNNDAQVSQNNLVAQLNFPCIWRTGAMFMTGEPIIFYNFVFPSVRSATMLLRGLSQTLTRQSAVFFLLAKPSWYRYEKYYTRMIARR